MSCSNKTNTCEKVTKSLCWVAGTDESLIYNLKHYDENDEIVTTDITGFSSTLEIKVKVTDEDATLSKEAVIDIEKGQFVFDISDIETDSLLTNSKLNRYKFRVLETDASDKITLRMEGDIQVRV